MTALVANRNYRFLFSATTVSNLGDGVAALAFPWLATLLTRDPVLIALVAFATRLPWFLFAVPVGALVDRHDRRRLMVQADLFRLLFVAGHNGVGDVGFARARDRPDPGAGGVGLSFGHRRGGAR